MNNQRVAARFSILIAVFLPLSALAADLVVGTEAGFYGGVSVRRAAVESPGLVVGPAVSDWVRFASPLVDDRGGRTLVFGGYRFANDTAVEAAYSSADRYALRGDASAAGPRGVGLSLPVSASPFDDRQSRRWNVDVFGSWAFYRSLALYGRLGYAQGDIPFALSQPASAAERRMRDGLNYGVGLRFDMNSQLGLRLEYSRFGRFAGEMQNGMPDTDQVSVGLQLRF